MPPSNAAYMLVDRFDAEPVFWRQLEIAQQIVSLGDKSVLPRLEHWLRYADRHARGNAAFIFAGLGDPRGIEVIGDILTDFSDRPEGQHGFISNGLYDAARLTPLQIKEDRYYAVHLLGRLKDPRAVPWLVLLLADDSVNYHAAWALSEIGSKAAVDPLIASLSNKSPDMRVAAIQALQKLGAKKAVPRLRVLLTDAETIHTDGLISVGTAASTALAVLATP